MAEERGCANCWFYNPERITCELTGGVCVNFSKWQPITEERSCWNCGLSSYNNVDEKGCGARGVSDCVHHSKWQPIKKAPSFQMTEEEFKKLLHECVAYSGEMDIDLSVQEAKMKGYIRKSELVELVEEAEEGYKLWNYNHNNNIDNGWSETVSMLLRLYNVIQALIKDHPEFGGKK